MSDLDIIRAWKDEVYRTSLSADEQAHLPTNPAGAMELSEDELQGVDGGTTPTTVPFSIYVTQLVTETVLTYAVTTIIGSIAGISCDGGTSNKCAKEIY